MSKRTCPITRDQFSTKAKDRTASIDGQAFVAAVKEFSTGSLGWYASTKMTFLVDGVPTDCQVGLQITLIGSKELPKTAQAAA